MTQAFNTAIDWLIRQKIDVTSPDAEATASRDRLQGGKPGIGSGGINRFSTGKIGIHFRSVNDWRRMWPIVGTASVDMLPVPAVRGSRARRSAPATRSAPTARRSSRTGPGSS